MNVVLEPFLRTLQLSLLLHSILNTFSSVSVRGRMTQVTRSLAAPTLTA